MKRWKKSVSNSSLLYFPEIPVLAQEHYENGKILPNEGWVFIIDPIDGTTEFSRGSHKWSIFLSAVKNLKPSIGMLFMSQDIEAISL